MENNSIVLQKYTLFYLYDTEMSKRLHGDRII